MPKYRSLGAMLVIVAVLLAMFSSVASAHRGHMFWPARFDNIWTDLRGLDVFTATPGNRDLIIGLGVSVRLHAVGTIRS